MGKIIVEFCPSCGDYHSRVKLHRPKRPAISDGYFICPVTREAVHHYDTTAGDNQRREAYGRFAAMIQRRRWLLLMSIADVGDNVNVEHPVESHRITHEFPTGDVDNVLAFVAEQIATIRPTVEVKRLAASDIHVHDPLAHLDEETDAAHPAATVATVPGDASPDGSPGRSSVGRQADGAGEHVPSKASIAAAGDRFPEG